MMASESPNPARRLSLPVLQSSAKIEELRAQPSSAKPNGSPDSGPHVHQKNPSIQLSPERQALEEKVVAALRTVYDPEIPVNLYDLGLIYNIEINPDNSVLIRMTLTAPGCPVADVIPQQVQTKVEMIPEVKSATVELVWEPTWTKEMMSEAARLELGL